MSCVSRLLIGSFACVFLVACAGTTPTPKPPIDPTYRPYQEGACEAACGSLVQLSCIPSDKLAKCNAFCHKVIDSGYLSLEMACLANARTPAEVRNCGADCKVSQ
jgi:hypothetical protein